LQTLTKCREFFMRLEDFDIAIFRLKEGEHNFTYHINEQFFSLFANSIVDQGKGEVNVFLDKQDTLLTLKLNISGSAELVCDRSLQPFTYPIQVNETLLIKYGPEENFDDDKMLIITRETPILNIAQFVYELFSLAIPMKRLHPDLQEEDDPFTDLEMVYSSGKDEDENDSDEENIDPRWQALKNLRDNNNSKN
jgi:uncharacterized protein